MSGSVSPMSRLLRRLVLISVAFGLLATACGGGAAPTSAESAEASANELLTGTFETFGRPDIDLASAQDSDVVLWFWAPW